MEVEYSDEQSSQPHILATWTYIGVLIDIGEVSSNGMAMRLEITVEIGDVVPSSDMPNLELVSGDFIPH